MRVPLLWVVSWICVVSASISATAQVSFSRFIASAAEDFEVKTFEEQTAFLETKPYRLSPLRELEYRHTNYELLDVRNRMGIRITPANPWEIRANNQYHRDYLNSLSFQRELAFRSALEARYLAAIEYLYYTSLRETHLQSTKLLQEQLLILQKQSGSGLFDASEYAKLRVEQLSQEVEFADIDFELSQRLHALEAMHPEIHTAGIDWKIEQLITVGQIKTVVDSMVTASVKSTLIAYEQQKIRTAQSHYKAEKYDWQIGFVQGTYDQWRNEQGAVPLILSFGVSIPVTNQNKAEMTRRKLQVIEAEYDLRESERETDRDRVMLQDQLATMIDRYTGVEQRVEELKSGKLAQSLSAIKGGDPLIFLQVNERIAKLELLLFKIRRDIFSTYVMYLSMTDRLQRQPLTNYLLPGLPLISE